MFEIMKKLVLSVMDDKRIEITENSKLIADLKINSYDLLDIVCDLEAEFDIEIPDKKLRTFITIRDVMDYIESQKSV